MRRYFFYAPSEQRAHQRSNHCIEFKLTALYAEDVWSTARSKQEKRFSYFDKVEIRVATRTPGLYDFKVETGTDSCMGDGTKSEKEMVANKAKFGYQRISERAYSRLRKLAVALLFHHSKAFSHPVIGENKFAWRNSTDDNFYDIKIQAYNHKECQDPEENDFLQRFKLPALTVTVPEEIRIFIAKASDRQFKCFNFEIKSGFTCRYKDFTEASRYLMRDDYRGGHADWITELQFERVRKICLTLMGSHYELDQQAILKQQDYSVRMLDNW